MFSLAPFATLVAVALSVSALPVPQRNHKTISVRDAPAGWAHGYLESYDVYHDRYLALDCQSQHDTTFFDDCCHPLLSTETLSGNRASQCTPSAAAATSAAAVEPVAVSSAAVEEVATSTASPAPAAAATSAAVEEEEECEAEDEETVTSSAAPVETTASPAAETTAANVVAAVVPTTSAAPAPAPTTTTAEAPAATTAASTPVGGDVKSGGFATYFLQNGNPGACGNYNPDSLPLVAITAEYWGGNSGQQSDACGKTVTIERVSDGRKVNAIVADLCPSCVNSNSLDLSVGAFTQIASESEGMVDIKWSFN